MSDAVGKWPKRLLELTEEQLKIKDEFMHKWLDDFPKKYGAMEVFNQNYPARAFRKDRHRKDWWETVEIGGGLGSHVAYEDISIQNYTIVELRQNILDTLKERHPEITGLLGDCQKEYSPSNTYDRVIAIHVLEHLPNLPEALRQMHRVMRDEGVAHIVIPCEGSFAYSMCRKISAERMFHKIYHMDYSWFIKSEHINLPYEIIEEIEKYFIIKHKRYFPIPVPLEFCNIAIGMTLYPRKDVDSEK